MRINFYEEFPTKRNLAKLKLVRFPSTVFVAAHSLEEFYKISGRFGKKGIEFAYWPVIPGSYWISPFSDTRELGRLLDDLKKNRVYGKGRKLKVLIDLEFPHKRRLILRDFLYFFRNKSLIRAIFRKAPEFRVEIFTAEYANSNWIKEFMLRLLGLSYSFKIRHKRSIMFYTSAMSRKGVRNTRKFIKGKVRKYGSRYLISLGLLARGITGNEPLLAPSGLADDLEFCRGEGADEVIIYRLGGLNIRFMKVIRKFL